MRNPFKSALQGPLYSSAYAGLAGGTTETGQYFIATDTAGDRSDTYPELEFDNNIVGDVTENMQYDSLMPQYTGVTERETSPAAGLPVGTRSIHNDIDFSLGAGIATNDQVPYYREGPVKGTGAGSNWTGESMDYNREVLSQDGPVTGTGQNYAQQLAQAYFAAEAEAIVEADRVSALLSVI